MTTTKRRTAAEIIAFHFGWDMGEVSETRYQPTRYTSPAVYVLSDDYYCAPSNNQPPKYELGEPWQFVAEYYGRKIFVSRLEGSTAAKPPISGEAVGQYPADKPAGGYRVEQQADGTHAVFNSGGGFIRGGWASHDRTGALRYARDLATADEEAGVPVEPTAADKFAKTVEGIGRRNELSKAAIAAERPEPNFWWKTEEGIRLHFETERHSEQARHEAKLESLRTEEKQFIYALRAHPGVR